MGMIFQIGEICLHTKKTYIFIQEKYIISTYETIETCFSYKSHMIIYMGII